MAEICSKLIRSHKFPFNLHKNRCPDKATLLVQVSCLHLSVIRVIVCVCSLFANAMNSKSVSQLIGNQAIIGMAFD